MAKTRREPQDRLGHVINLAEPADRMHRGQGVEEPRLFGPRLNERRVDHAGAHRVYPDAERRIFQRRRSGQPHHRVFGRDIIGRVRPPHQAHSRSQIDDGPAAAAQHDGNFMAHALPHALDVYAHHPIEIVFRNIGQWHPAATNAGVVHRHVQPTVARDHRIDHRRHGSTIAHIQRKGHGPAPDLARHTLGGIGGHITQRDYRALGGESPGRCRADARAATGNQHYLILEHPTPCIIVTRFRHCSVFPSQSRPPMDGTPAAAVCRRRIWGQTGFTRSAWASWQIPRPRSNIRS